MNYDLTKAPEAIRRLNPEIFAPVGALQGAPSKPAGRPAAAPAHRLQVECQSRVQDKSILDRHGQPRIHVTLVSHRRRLSPDASDSLARGFKPLRDIIAESLGLDDADACIRWQYGQVETRGEEGVTVKIERV